MPGIARLSDEAVHGDVSAGTGAEASTTVFANGLAVHRYGDPWNSHEVPKAGIGKETHEGLTISGGCSSTVSAEGKAVAMIGSTISCGAVINQGSEDVIVA
jgi:uncharacterized Zn-binding protein involved in type VI secretion